MLVKSIAGRQLDREGGEIDSQGRRCRPEPRPVRSFTLGQFAIHGIHTGSPLLPQTSTILRLLHLPKGGGECARSARRFQLFREPLEGLG